MKCAAHPEADAVGYCRNCGKALCAVCVRPVRDVLYCEDCLANVLGHAGAVPAQDFGAPTRANAPNVAAGTGQRNPALAFILGFLFPGLGAVYNGQYNKALIHIVVFATLILGLSSDMDGGMKAVMGIMLGAFTFYMAFDAMQTAQAERRGEVSADPLQTWSKGQPIGPIILIGAGVLFLLYNFDIFPFYRIERFWPLILIAVGVLMFKNRLAGRS